MATAPKRHVRTARIVLKRALRPGAIEYILARAAQHYRTLAGRGPCGKTVGGCFALTMARYTIALYYALSELNISAETIAALLADINYQLVRRPQMLLNRISASRFRDPLLRLRWKSQLARRFYYRSPDWVMKEVPVADGYGLDVQRCIIADYFQSLGLGKLCEQTICIQDFRLADRRGDCLIRTETIAGSAKRCDFRYLRTQATGENCDHRKTVTPAPSP